MSESNPEERVNHPDHYNWIPGIECLDVVEHFDFNMGNAIKYIWRAPTKSAAEGLVDLRKAKFYLEREITRIERSIHWHEPGTGQLTD